MKLQLLSDLHLESQPDFQATRAPGAELLVLAGDVGSYQAGSRLRGDDFGLERFSPRLHPELWPTVLFVPGNHEFDSLEYDAAYTRLRETCERLGITWLERETVTRGGVRFIGTTLWSDFAALAQSEPTPTRQLKALEKAHRAANFYLRQHSTLRHGERVLAPELAQLAQQCQDWLRAELNKPFDGTTVVVTHFAPSLRSADPRYGLTPGTAGFCNALDALLPQADLWLHGHLHCANDYVVSGENWRCRVAANPLGYARKDEQRDFRPEFCIELPD